GGSSDLFGPLWGSRSTSMGSGSGSHLFGAQHWSGLLVLLFVASQLVLLFFSLASSQQACVCSGGRQITSTKRIGNLEQREKRGKRSFFPLGVCQTAARAPSSRAVWKRAGIDRKST